MTQALASSFKALGDPTRLRALLLLRIQELTVTELQRVLGGAQSTVSGLLRVLMQAGLVHARRDGRHAFYKASEGIGWVDAALGGAALGADDLAELERIRAARLGERDGDDAADIDRSGVPGRSWETLARSLLELSRLGVVADLGVGPGELTLLLAGAAERVYAVDREPDRLAAVERRAREAGLRNLIAIASDFAEVTLPEPVDLVVLSLSLHFAERPAAVVARAHEQLRPGGRLWITELAAHEHTWTMSRLGHRWLGFAPETLRAFLADAGFVDTRVRRGGRDRRKPRLRSLIAIGTRRQGPEGSI